MVETGTKRIDSNKGKPITFYQLEDGCIICTSHSVNHDGYHRVYNGKGMEPRMVLLHRATWQAKNGPIPDGYELDHKCRNRRCCNPEHLQLLTISAHKTKTNLERYAGRIELIKEEVVNGVSCAEIAIKYDVCYGTVARYKRKMKEINE